MFVYQDVFILKRDITGGCGLRVLPDFLLTKNKKYDSNLQLIKRIYILMPKHAFSYYKNLLPRKMGSGLLMTFKKLVAVHIWQVMKKYLTNHKIILLFRYC